MPLPRRALWLDVDVGRRRRSQRVLTEVSVSKRAVDSQIDDKSSGPRRGTIWSTLKYTCSDHFEQEPWYIHDWLLAGHE